MTRKIFPRPKLALLLIGLLLLIGCRLAPAPSTLPPHEAPATATATPAPPPAPTPTAPPACQVKPDVPLPPAPTDLTSAAQALETYLAAGGDPTAIPAALRTWGLAARSGHTVVQADLTGNGSNEVIVALEQTKDDAEPTAQLQIYTCQDGAMRSLYSAELGSWFNVNLVGAADLTGDGKSDLVFAEVSCGANTCWHTLHLWSWNGHDFQDQVGSDFTYPYPTFSLRDQTLLVRSDGIASVGAGPQRPYTDTLVWNGHALTVTATITGPIVYRYHMLITGDKALYTGEYAQARAAYERVLTDDTLRPWDAFYPVDEERAWLDALARWRLLTLAAHAQDYTAAETQLQTLQSDDPPGSPGAAVAELAQLFWQRFMDTGNIAYGCQAVIQSPKVNDVLLFLNNYGYANPLYTEQDLCPFDTP